MSESKKRYQLTISFDASERNAQAFFDALALICDSWTRHKRLENTDCNLTEFSCSISQEDDSPKTEA